MSPMSTVGEVRSFIWSLVTKDHLDDSYGYCNIRRQGLSHHSVIITHMFQDNTFRHCLDRYDLFVMCCIIYYFVYLA